MKTVLITGASRGIGAEVARVFAENGYAVLINYNKSQSSANQLLSELTQKGYYAKLYQADISVKKEVDDMFDKIYRDFSHIDVLVNNAGVAYFGLCNETGEEVFDRLFGVNMKGVFLATNGALKSMLDKKSGAIVNISSVWGLVGASCESVYSAAKSAVIGYTKSLAKELGLSGIRVNCILPGVIDTEMNARLTEEDKLALKEETPLNQIGTARQVANAVYFFASENSSFITGQVLAVDGGFAL